MRRFYLFAFILLIIFSACDSALVFRRGEIRSYRDIPGVTREEINQIEQIKSKRDYFIYGHLPETESFQRDDGTYAGFTIELCKLLSELFEIEFIPNDAKEVDNLRSGISSHSIDFTGSFTPAVEQLLEYHMTDPIAGRTLKLYTVVGMDDIQTEADINGRRIGFLNNSATPQIVVEHYPELEFELLRANSIQSAVNMLRSGEIDAFVVESTADVEFEPFPFIQSKPFFPVVYIPVAISTANDEFIPIINVINRYLRSGAISTIFELYVKGNTDYTKHKVYQSLNIRERAYLKSLVNTQKSVDVGIQYDLYPISFYNQNTRQYEGIAVDILNEISMLTDITFNPNAISNRTSFSDILILLEQGEIMLTTQLLQTDARQGRFIWNEHPFLTTNYALLSHASHPDILTYQVYYERVGTIRDYSHTEQFHNWFPGHERNFVFETSEEGFLALEKGRIDLLMLDDSMVLYQTNYREKPGYKVNIKFHSTVDSYFGFNNEAEILRDIMDKTMLHINTETIADRWMNRVFDYSAKMARMQVTYITIFAAVMVVALVFLTSLLLKTKKLDKIVMQRTATLSTVYASIPDIVFSMDKDMTYTSVNPSFEKFANRTQEEIIGKNDYEVFNQNKEMVDYFDEINKQVLDTGETKVIQETVTYPDGTQRILETIKTPLIQDGKLTGLLGIARDITEHKEKEREAYEASHAKTLFLANMSHEIRTPMNAIIGMAELLQNEMLTNRQRNYVKDINNASHSLLGIINDILDISKIEAGKMDLNPVDYDFRLLLDNIGSTFQYVTQKKGLDFVLDKDDDLPECLYGDDLRLRQTLVNIIGNAVKFTHVGYIRLHVSKIADMIRLEIKDTGQGIKEEAIPKLFTAFSQTDTLKNRNIVGTGLGLSLSKAFIEMMGGSISVSSLYGVGSVFTVNVPMVLGDMEKVKHDSAQDEEKMLYAPSAKVLVVDDNEVNLKVATGLLRLLGIEAQTASSGEEAINVIKGSDFDLVYMDHMMPEMDGVEATKAIRALGYTLPIIALSANAIRGVREMFIENGLNGFVSKPIDMVELVKSLREWIPEEKQEEHSERIDAQPAESKDDTFLAALRNVEGINADTGLSHVSGLVEMYLHAVEIFHKNLKQDIEEMDASISNQNWKSFTIGIHAMKSELATIGAQSLSEAAFEMEKASRDGDYSYCQTHFPPFLQSLNKLDADLMQIVPHEEKNEVKMQGDDENLKTGLKKVQQAADDFDQDACIVVLDELLNYDFGEEKNNVLQDAKNAAMDFDFDRLADLLK